MEGIVKEFLKDFGRGRSLFGLRVFASASATSFVSGRLRSEGFGIEESEPRCPVLGPLLSTSSGGGFRDLSGCVCRNENFGAMASDRSFSDFVLFYFQWFPSADAMSFLCVHCDGEQSAARWLMHKSALRSRRGAVCLSEDKGGARSDIWR